MNNWENDWQKQKWKLLWRSSDAFDMQKCLFIDINFRKPIQTWSVIQIIHQFESPS